MISFKMNQEYIAATLCENKDKPQLHCNGKCVLSQKLKQAEEKEQKQRTQQLNDANVLFFSQLNTTKLVVHISMHSVSFNPFYLHFKPTVFLNDIFKPPQVFIG